MGGHPGAPSLFTPAEALDLVRDEFDLGLADPRVTLSVLAVDVTERTPELSALEALATGLPCVTVGVAPDPSWVPGGFDVLLCQGSTVPRPWVGCDDLERSLVDLGVSIDRSPLASVALVQLLRMGEELSLRDAVVAESFVYSMLQGGPEFRTWLESRRTSNRAQNGETDPVLVTRHGPFLDIELHRPEVHNALNSAMRDALITALQLVQVDPTIEAARLRGSGPDFCSGGDLNEFGSATDPATAHSVRVSRSAGLALARCADRVRVEVHGACVGAGIEIPAFSHRISATPEATFTLPEVGFGLIPGAGGTASLPRRIGRQRTAFAALSGSAVSAHTARQWGLVDELRA